MKDECLEKVAREVAVSHGLRSDGQLSVDQARGLASDIEVQAREIIRMNARLQEIMAADTGQSAERVAHDINRDYWMSAAEAKDYGVIDLIYGQTAAPTSLSTGGR